MIPVWLQQVGYVALCIGIPIVWGWLVNYLFALRRRRKPDSLDPVDEMMEYYI